jgi:hypothetical protein
MARKVVWTETAWRDLERSADYIAEDSPGYAAAFVERVREQARSLDELTHRGRVVPEFGEPTVREPGAKACGGWSPPSSVPSLLPGTGSWVRRREAGELSAESQDHVQSFRLRRGSPEN